VKLNGRWRNDGFRRSWDGPSLSMLGSNMVAVAVPLIAAFTIGVTAFGRMPRGSVQIWMTELWQEILGIETIGVEDDFFEIGGYSQTATRIVAEISQEFGVRVKAWDFYLNPTIAGVTTHVTALLSAEENDEPGERT
jgi:Phosphopantetheine attachment site